MAQRLVKLSERLPNDQSIVDPTATTLVGPALGQLLAYGWRNVGRWLIGNCNDYIIISIITIIYIFPIYLCDVLQLSLIVYSYYAVIIPLLQAIMLSYYACIRINTTLTNHNLAYLCFIDLFLVAILHCAYSE